VRTRLTVYPAVITFADRRVEMQSLETSLRDRDAWAVNAERNANSLAVGSLPGTVIPATIYSEAFFVRP
jgi:hypothetical protein